MPSLPLVTTFVAGRYRVEKYPDALKVHYLLTTARLETMGSLIFVSCLAVVLLLGGVGFLFQKDVEGGHWLGYVFCGAASLPLFLTLPELADYVRPTPYVFDRTKNGLFKRNKCLCCLTDISHVEVERIESEESDYAYYSGRVCCGERDVWHFRTDNFSLKAATEIQKGDVYRVADEVSRFLGLAPPVEVGNDA